MGDDIRLLKFLGSPLQNFVEKRRGIIIVSTIIELKMENSLSRGGCPSFSSYLVLFL